MHDLTVIDIVSRLMLALVFGAVVGWERERQDMPAGLRTNMLVALGSAGFTLVAIAMIDQYLITGPDTLPIDPAKIVAGIVGGVGFLGAGAIIQSRGRVHGMTTAAGIWVVSAVGVASGAGYYVIAGVMVGLSVFTLVAVRWFEERAAISEKARDKPADEAE